MSNLVTSTAMLRKVGSPLRKAILMYMADRASDDGSGIWSSKSNMAADLETSRRTVQREIKAMIEMGIVCEVGSRDCKSGFTVEYAINLGALNALDGTRDTLSPVTPCHPKGRPPVTPPRDTLSHKPPIEPPIEPNPPFSRDAGASNEGMWKSGLSDLVGLGISERSARSIIGKWCKTYGTDAISQAIDQAKESGTGDPVAYVTRTLEPLKKKTTFELACELNDKGPAFNAKW